jgi:hypothetical protein
VDALEQIDKRSSRGFAMRLREGNPPDDWVTLFREADAAGPGKPPTRKRTVRKIGENDAFDGDFNDQFKGVS